MSATVWLVFAVAAVLEVGGDAMIRVGMRGGGLPFVLGGAVILGCYGVTINTTSWDFTRLLGAYVAVFAVTSTVCGRLVFADRPSMTTYFGLALLLAGAVVIQRGG